MANNNNTTLTSLDFDTLVSNFAIYLQGQSEFEDYQFQGSGLRQIMNLLGYNSHLLSFYLNMALNEAYPDTAVLRSSIVSHAKLVGYTPKSATSAQATVNVTITKANSDPTTALSLPRFTKFASDPVGGVSYNFLSIDSQTVSVVGNDFVFNGVNLKEGTPVSKTFLYASLTNPTQTFSLDDEGIDTATLQVIVQNSSTSQIKTTYSYADDATVVTSNANVYYLEESKANTYNIFFGDGIIGNSLVDGNLVNVSYLKTVGNAANGIGKFRLQSAVLSGSTSNTSTWVASSAGSDPESAQSVQLASPKFYLSQNRAVTTDDYTNLLNRKYPYFDAITVWGGEEESPPIYGKVFIAAKPKAGFAVTETQKQYVIDNILTGSSVLTVIPEFVDADYNYMNFRTTVFYDPSKTNYTAGQMSTLIRNSIINFCNLNLNTFDSTFKVSKLLRAIDDTDYSISSSSVNLFLEKRFDPILNLSQSYQLNFGVALTKALGNNRLYSSPGFYALDFSGTQRICFFEETPDTATGIDSINILNPGKNFTSTPALVIEGDGVGANAYAQIVNGKIDTVVIDKPGINYTTAVISIQGGGGSSASLEAVVQGRTGVIRTYYFDDNNIKTILNPNAGVVNYDTGVINIVNFSPLDVDNTTKTISLHIQPSDYNVSTTHNRILTYDPNDLSAIVITLKASS